jgi:hypothetical protein
MGLKLSAHVGRGGLAKGRPRATGALIFREPTRVSRLVGPVPHPLLCRSESVPGRPLRLDSYNVLTCKIVAASQRSGLLG